MASIIDALDWIISTRCHDDPGYYDLLCSDSDREVRNVLAAVFGEFDQARIDSVMEALDIRRGLRIREWLPPGATMTVVRQLLTDQGIVDDIIAIAIDVRDRAYLSAADLLDEGLRTPQLPELP